MFSVRVLLLCVSVILCTSCAEDDFQDDSLEKEISGMQTGEESLYIHEGRNDSTVSLLEPVDVKIVNCFEDYDIVKLVMEAYCNNFLAARLYLDSLKTGEKNAFITRWQRATADSISKRSIYLVAKYTIMFQEGCREQINIASSGDIDTQDLGNYGPLTVKFVPYGQRITRERDTITVHSGLSAISIDASIGDFIGTYQ